MLGMLNSEFNIIIICQKILFLSFFQPFSKIIKTVFRVWAVQKEAVDQIWLEFADPCSRALSFHETN